ncbi:uncharacterized protein LOC128560384 [Nycticebus coucang]|uniref:uncharacterized protein LOC128560384 n=1 Tax=Nycticebus coucang TaxID=9470 RepID=UPI00234C7735|nr:uncharacterized protein LOC128560384 [Nycticebus coucang]
MGDNLQPGQDPQSCAGATHWQRGTRVRAEVVSDSCTKARMRSPLRGGGEAPRPEGAAQNRSDPVWGPRAPSSRSPRPPRSAPSATGWILPQSPTKIWSPPGEDRHLMWDGDYQKVILLLKGSSDTVACLRHLQDGTVFLAGAGLEPATSGIRGPRPTPLRHRRRRAWSPGELSDVTAGGLSVPAKPRMTCHMLNCPVTPGKCVLTKPWRTPCEDEGGDQDDTPVSQGTPEAASRLPELGESIDQFSLPALRGSKPCRHLNLLLPASKL